MRRHLLVTSCLAAFALAIAVPASAQMNPPPRRPERPYRGLFGGGVGTTEQQLTASFSLGGGYDDDLSAEAGGPPTSFGEQPRRGGPFGSANAGLGYSLGLERLSFNANYGMQGRYYRDIPSNFLAGHSLAGGAHYKVTDSLDISADASLSYQPFYAMSLIPRVFDPALGALSLADPAISYLRQKYFGRATGVSVSQRLGDRTSIAADYTYQLSGVLQDDGYSTRAIGASISHGLAKGLAARLGYGANEAVYADEAGRRRVRFRSIDGGLDYSRSLSLTRRTLLGFTTGTAAANNGGRSHFTFVGTIELSRELGRTWNAGVSAARSMQLDPILRDITITNGVSVGVGGMISQRLQLHAGAGTSFGSVGFDAPGNGLVSSSASASLQYGITRYVALGLQYTYYYTTYEDDVVLPIGWARYVDRQSFSANVNLWAPLMTRTRRPNASR